MKTETDCGLPYGGCYLCNPEQPNDRETREAREELEDIMNDQQRGDQGYTETFSKTIARRMLEVYGAEKAMKVAVKRRLETTTGSPQRVHWDRVIGILENAD